MVKVLQFCRCLLEPTRGMLVAGAILTLANLQWIHADATDSASSSTEAVGTSDSGALLGQLQEPFERLTVHTLVALFVLLTAVCLSWYVLSANARRPAAFPGGPRSRRIYRSPEWKRNGSEKRCKYPVESGWKYVEGSDSHIMSQARFSFGGGVHLTGESSGRQTWQYLQEPDRHDATTSYSNMPFDASKNPNSADLLYRRQQLLRSSKRDMKGNAYGVGGGAGQVSAAQAALKAAEFYMRLQCEDGHWGGDYGGPMFLMPGLIIVAYVTRTMDELLQAPHRRAMVCYLRNHQQADGGWGTHIESPSTMFGTTLSYVSLRLLGVHASDPAMRSGRKFMHQHGGALYTSSWAKFWLCVLGVYSWKGVNSIPPEMWLLPEWFPFHPGKMWCHARMVYLPMCYLYGKRWTYSGAKPKPGGKNATEDPLIAQLRSELYLESNYGSIPWDAHRHSVAPIDNYSPITIIMRCAHNALSWYEWAFGGPESYNPLRRAGLAFALEYMRAEDLQTNFVDIGPVNKTMNMLSMYASACDNKDSNPAATYEFQMHALRVDDYLWVAEDGMKMQGYNGSQCWDTSFAARAVTEAGLCRFFPQAVGKMWGFLERTQILSTAVSQSTPAFAYESKEARAQYFRHVSKGGWPFSTSAHGWPISDCTAEGLKAVLALRNTPSIKSGIKNGQLRDISDQRLFDAVEVVLSMQNKHVDGGWATYENTRGGAWYELLNPSEVFGDIMIDYSYVECSSASLCCLSDFQEQFPDHRPDEIRRAIRKGCRFIESIQRDDGSWYGSWACCFTYGTWFGVEALVHAGKVDPRKSKAVQKAVAFLLSHQNENGGWGEDFTSCYDKDYAVNGAEKYGEGGSSVVNTAWAMLALVEARCEDMPAMQKGADFLIRMQDSDTGDWAQEGIAGVFNRACGITYTQYRSVFPLWALGRWANYTK